MHRFRRVALLIAFLAATLLSPFSPVSAAQEQASESFDLIVVGSEGPRVFLLQKRLEDLGYYTFRATGVFGAITRNAVVAFQQANDIIVDGTVGEESYSLMFGNGVKRTFASSALAQAQGPEEQQTEGERITGKPLEWKQVQNTMKIGQTYTVTDYYTQISFSVTRTGGSGHADVECAASADFANFRAIFGGNVSWEKRPVVVTLGGSRVAASLFGMPHGYRTISTSGMSGHVCLYFTGSTVGEQNITDVEHEEMIQIAAGP